MKKVVFGGKPPVPPVPAAADDWVTNRELVEGPPAEPTKRFTFDVPLSLHRRVKAKCVMEDRNMADVVRELLEREFPA